MKLRRSKKPRVNFRRTYRNQKSNTHSVRRNISNITHSGKMYRIPQEGGDLRSDFYNRFSHPLGRSTRDTSQTELTSQNIGEGEVHNTFFGNISNRLTGVVSDLSQKIKPTYNPVFLIFREFADMVKDHINIRDVAILGLISGEYIKAGWIPVSDGTGEFSASYTTPSTFSRYTTESQINALKSLFDVDAVVPKRNVMFNLMSCIIDSRFVFVPIYKKDSKYTNGILLGYIVYNTINKADTIHDSNTRSRIHRSIQHGQMMVKECTDKLNSNDKYDINLLTNRIFGFQGTKRGAILSREETVSTELTDTDLYYNEGIFPIMRNASQSTTSIIYIKYKDSLKNPVQALVIRNIIRAYEESVISYLKLFDLFGASSYEIKNDVMTASLDTLIKVLSNSVEPTNRLSAEPLLTIAGKSVLCSHFAFFILGQSCTDYMQLSNPTTVEVYKKASTEYIVNLRRNQITGGSSNPIQSLRINNSSQSSYDTYPRQVIPMQSNPLQNRNLDTNNASMILEEFFNKAIVLLNRISASVNTLTRSTTSAFRLSLISIILLHMMDPITKKHVDLDKRYSSMPIPNAIRCKIEVINAITNMLDKFVIK